ncbi:major intrinsic protein [Bifidobacterium sp. DSM 109958]|uniref:Major intrinsic protein n=1 Tax=Bifidobacterium moraviense TaxID=2675323 RepID=A0A7Y0F282_9BIFI|nr:aquaporin [Bifidobacterium sp. DSM 109958]NMM99746.1 major intrinsic protein [Bifidobacterium sp. DSM 109958]
MSDSMFPAGGETRHGADDRDERATIDRTTIFEPHDGDDRPVYTTSTPRRGVDAGRLAMRFAAEFVGTALVVFPILLVYTLSQLIYQYAGLMPIITVTALAYGAVSAMMGRVSGAQLNPAVTVAAMLTSRTHWLDGIVYVVAQVLGGIAAAALYVFILPVSESVPASTWLTMAVKGFDEASRSSGALANAGISFGSTMAVVVELVAGLIVVGASVATLRRDGTASKAHAWVAALAYGLAASFTYPVTGASLNPAHATGIALLAHGKGLDVEPLSQLWVFWIAPLFAAAIVAVAMLVNGMVQGTLPVRADGADDALPADMDVPSEETDDPAADSVHEFEGHVEDGQSDAQPEADEGVERD